MDSVFWKPVIATASYFQPTTGENTMVRITLVANAQHNNNGKMMFCVPTIYIICVEMKPLWTVAFSNFPVIWIQMPPSPAHHHHHPLSSLALTSATAKSSSWWLLFLPGISRNPKKTYLNWGPRSVREAANFIWPDPSPIRGQVNEFDQVSKFFM